MTPIRHVVSEGRPHDYVYDPDYTVCSQRDFYKHASIAARSGATLKLRPVFKSMFSDLRRDRRLEACLVLPKPNILENFMPQHNICGIPVKPMDDTCIIRREVDPTGADRAKFISRYSPETYYMAHPAVQLEDIDEKRKSHKSKKRQKGLFINRGVQTDYRESETQTDPYSPEFTLPFAAAYPKVLALIKMTWGKGLPATLDDIVVIERALTRRMIEIGVHDADDENDFEKRVKLMEELEAQQWKDREEELNKIMLLKMDLVSKLLKDMKNKTAYVHTMRMENAYDTKKKETLKKLAQIRHTYLRDLRRIEEKYLGKRKPTKRDVVSEYLDHDSEIYTPLARNGINRDRLHKVPSLCSRDLLNFDSLEALANDPDFVKNQLTFDPEKCVERVSKAKVSAKTRRLESKLMDIFVAFRNETTRKPEVDETQFMKQVITNQIHRLSTPTIDSPEIKEEQKELCILNLQKVIRGRVVQVLMRDEISENMSTILQLKALHKADPFGLKTTYGQALAQLNLEEDRELQQEKQNEVTEIMDQLEGETLARMLDFLEKEMVRLLDERKIHAMIWMAERERRKREATEAGRRQKEEEERRINDEIFRQIIGIHQSTVDIYLEDMYLEAINRTADANARAYVQGLARTMNEAAYLTNQHEADVEKEELTADLVHCFILPELNRLYQQERLDAIGARYTMAARDVTDGVFSAQGVINETLDNIGPTIEEHMQRGEAAANAAEIMIDKVIKDAVGSVIRQEYPQFSKPQSPARTVTAVSESESVRDLSSTQRKPDQLSTADERDDRIQRILNRMHAIHIPIRENFKKELGEKSIEVTFGAELEPEAKQDYKNTINEVIDLFKATQELLVPSESSDKEVGLADDDDF